MKKKNKTVLLAVMWTLFLFLTPGLGAKASEKIEYLYITPAGDGTHTGVVISLDGEAPDRAVLDYGTGNVEASKIADHHLVFLMPGANVDQNSLKKLTLTRKGKTSSVSLDVFFRASDTEKLDKSVSDSQIAGGLSRAARQLSAAQEAEVRSYTAGNGTSITQALAQAEINAGAFMGRSRSGQDKNIVVVLDPGHGGAETGANRTWDGVTYEEKVINLKISRYTKAELEKYAGVTVYMTRNEDKTLSLEERVDYAASKKADVLVSQHINSTEKQQDTVSGSMIFVSSGNYRPALKTESWDLANKILTELSGLGLKDLGLQVRLSENNTLYPDDSLADYYGIIRRSVLKGFPGIIVEHAFVNNPADCKKYFGSEAALRKLGEADAAGIAKYYGLKLKTDVDNPDPAVSGKWEEENDRYFYVKEDGTRPVGWLTLTDGVYYLDESGYRTVGFALIGDKTYYFDENGLKKSGLISVDGNLYWMDSRGVMVKGWFKGYDGNRYYTDTDGRLKTGLVTRGSKTYYFDPETGAMQTGFVTIKNKRYYFRPSTGSMLYFGWVNINGKRYYFHEDGHAQKGLAQIDGERYFFRTDGSMIRSKWVYYYNHWYFTSVKGKVYRNTYHYIGGKRFYFNVRGICLERTAIPSGTYKKTTVLEM